MPNARLRVLPLYHRDPTEGDHYLILDRVPLVWIEAVAEAMDERVLKLQGCAGALIFHGEIDLDQTAGLIDPEANPK